jgi:RNA recognition motif-containing protein
LLLQLPPPHTGATFARDETEPPHEMPDEPEEVPPRETVYVNNLNERINKEEVKKSLYAAFSQFGPILDIVAIKSFRMRGQAFIVFRDISSATQAVRQMQGFPFYDKPMRLAYAKTKSDASAKLDGTFEVKAKADRAAKRKADREAREQKATSKRAAAAEGGAAAAEEANGASHSTAGGEGAGASAGAGAAPPAAQQSTVALPNPILFIENLPEQVNEMMLSMLFQQFPGYKEVRLVPGKAGIAFVEFESEMQSGVAMGGLQNFKITPQNLMKVSYAKR